METENSVDGSLVRLESVAIARDRIVYSLVRAFSRASGIARTPLYFATQRTKNTRAANSGVSQTPCTLPGLAFSGQSSGQGLAA